MFNITKEVFHLNGGAFRSWTQRLLGVNKLNIENSQGLKVKSFLKLRCNRCYFIRINGRMHVECKGSPRHKACEPFNTKLLW
uniref:Large ribosomal subunit protein bL36m n=1 Tax=Strongyloides venezuelensis TaxID=75913 RepID=A0A0K0F4W3_STRVS